MSHSTPPHQGEKGPGGEPGLPSPLGGSEMSCPPTGDGVRGALVRLQMSTTALSLHAPAVSGGRVGSSNAPFLWQKPRRDGELPPPFCTNEESPPCSPSTGSPQRPRAESGLLRTSNSNEEEPLLSCSWPSLLGGCTQLLCNWSPPRRSKMNSGACRPRVHNGRPRCSALLPADGKRSAHGGCRPHGGSSLTRLQVP